LYTLNSVQINAKNINDLLKDTPISLKSGYIESINVALPNLFKLFEDSMKIDINGIELVFQIKDAVYMDSNHSRNVLSSLLAESLIGDFGDPNVMTSSILVGDVRRSDLDEFESDVSSPTGSYMRSNDKKSSSSSANNDDGDEIGEAEGYIAQLIERIVSNIKASITNVTLRFEFPTPTTAVNSPLHDVHKNVFLMHFPRMDYADETPMPSASATWQPSIFKYKFTFKGFFVQVFDEHQEPSSSTTMMSASLFGQ
ncbi:ATG2, partial [Acrasis kona]